jgi:hypothetical protein
MTKAQRKFKEEVLSEMKELEHNTTDYEMTHINGDALLCKLLTKLGCEDVVKEFEDLRKWYA